MLDCEQSALEDLSGSSACSNLSGPSLSVRLFAQCLGRAFGTLRFPSGFEFVGKVFGLCSVLVSALAGFEGSSGFLRT